MGGMGSGREAEVYSGTVEESLHLDINLLVREGTIRKQSQTSGIISWDRPIWNKRKRQLNPTGCPSEQRPYP